MTELDQRRHELLDVRTQARRHALAVTVAAAFLVGAIWGWVRLGTRRARRDA